MFTVKFDGYVTQIHEKQLYQNVEFELMDSNGNITTEKGMVATKILASLDDNTIETCLFKHTDEAILHAKNIGLIVK